METTPNGKICRCLYRWVITIFLLCFSPFFCLISRRVQKIIHDQASGIPVIPLWTILPYSTVELSLLIDTPCILKASAQNLIHPTLDSPHLLHQWLKLLVCKLSGDPCWSQRFRQTLSKPSCIPGETALRNSAKCISTGGCNFVVKGHMIHCIPLQGLHFLFRTVSSRLAWVILCWISSFYSFQYWHEWRWFSGSYTGGKALPCLPVP